MRLCSEIVDKTTVCCVHFGLYMISLHALCRANPHFFTLAILFFYVRHRAHVCCHGQFYLAVKITNPLPCGAWDIISDNKTESVYSAVTRRRQEGHISEVPYQIIALTCPSVLWPLRSRPVYWGSNVNSKRLWYIPVCQKDSWCHTADLCYWCTEDEASITPHLKGREITHQRSPRSLHTPWPSKACSLSPSPERGGRVKGEGRRDDRDVEELIIYSNLITSIISKGKKQYSIIHMAFWRESGIHKVKRKTKSMNGTGSKYGSHVRVRRRTAGVAKWIWMVLKSSPST